MSFYSIPKQQKRHYQKFIKNKKKAIWLNINIEMTKVFIDMHRYLLVVEEMVQRGVRGGV